MNLEARAPHLWTYLPLDRHEVRSVVAAMCALLAVKTGAAAALPELIITDDTGSEECNCAHLDCPGPTNILSFPLAAQRGSSSGVLGSLVLSVTVLRRECLLYGQDPGEHCLRLLAHGLAHLAGLEHGRKMRELCAGLEKEGRRALSSQRRA